MKMKQNHGGFIVLLFVVFLVLMSSSAEARGLLLSRTPSAIVNFGEVAGDKSAQYKYINHHDEAASNSNDFSDLMGGSEDCDEKDEECVKRRMVAEAHLDYIYTQKHKQP